MAFDFPASPTNGQRVTTPSGSVFTFDGTKWTAASGTGNGTVTSIAAGTGLTASPSPIVATGTMSLTTPVSVANGGTGVSAGAVGPYLPLTGGTLSGALTVNSTINTTGNITCGGPSVYVASSSTRLFNDASSAGIVFNGSWGLYQTLSTGVLQYINSSAASVFTIDGAGNVASSGQVASATLNVSGNAVVGGSVSATTLNASGNAVAAASVYAGVGGVTRLFNDGGNAGIIFNGNWGWFKNISSSQLSYVNNSGTAIFFIDAGGSLAIPYGNGYKPGGGVWADSSDIRTKEAVEDYTRGLDAVRQLRPVSFRHNGRGGSVADGKTYIGLVANEAKDIMPEMVSVREEKLDKEDAHPTEILSLEATALIYALVNAVKELTARLEVVEEKT